MCLFGGNSGKILDPGGFVTRKVVGQDLGDKIDPIGKLVNGKKRTQPLVEQTNINKPATETQSPDEATRIA